jgi:hypothetical protein
MKKICFFAGNILAIPAARKADSCPVLIKMQLFCENYLNLEKYGIYWKMLEIKS